MKLTELKNLYDLGFSFLWVHPKKKNPIELGWSKKERLTWEYLTKTHSGLYNVGVRTGETAKLTGGGYLAIIDCDVRGDNPKHLQEMTWKLETLYPEWKEAPIVLSGRGGGSMHVYVKTALPTKTYTFGASNEIVETLAPSADITSRDREAIDPERLAAGYRLKRAWEISVSGNGHQVVMPPSVHPDSGNAYVWQMGEPSSCDEIPLAAIGREDAKARREEDKAKASLTEIVDVCLDDRGLDADLIEMIREKGNEGDRSTNMFFVAQRLFKAGFDEDEVVSVLVDKRNAISEGVWARKNTEAGAIAWVRDHTVAKAQAASPRVEFSGPVSEGVPLSEEAAAAQFEGMVGNGEGDWRLRLERVGNGEGTRIKASQINVMDIVLNAVGERAIVKDLFSHRISYGMDTPWGGDKGTSLLNDDLAVIKEWLAREWAISPGTEMLRDAISALGRRNSFHPVREYILGLKWDGVSRNGTWLRDYFEADMPEPYLSQVSRKVLCGMVSRIFEPGCKMDHVLILEGKQGKGKSMLTQILAGAKWHTDTELRIGDKDAMMAMQGKWIVELGELSAMRKADVESLKSFITSPSDWLRKPFMPLYEDVPRQCIFIGTTNNESYLKDATGGRRFWPVKVGQLDFDGIRAARDQMLAEAYFDWTMGEELRFNDEASVQAVEIQEDRQERDELTDVIGDFIDAEARRPGGFRAYDFMAIELLMAMKSEFANIPSKGMVERLYPDRSGLNRIGASLKKLGFKNENKMVRGKRARRWGKSY